MEKERPSRRQFLARSLSSAAALSIPAIVPSSVLGIGGKPGANERTRIAVVGMGARGQNLIGNLPATAQVAAICDCSRSRLKRVFKPKGKLREILAPFLAGPDASRLTSYQDIRLLLDREKLDGLVIATPDHNHAWIAVRAMAAGLDLYLEKPLTTTIAEGRAVVDAAKRHGRIVQVGSQQRTMEINRFACEFVRDGHLGTITHVDARNLPGPLLYDGRPREEKPDSLDWGLFCGPTPLRPYNRALWLKDEYRVDGLLWRGWDIWRDYSGHLTTNWGAHSFDMAQYALGKDDTGPVAIDVEKPGDGEIAALAQEWSHKTPVDDRLGLAPENQRRFWPVTLRYADGVEIRLRPGIKTMCFHGERGKLSISRNKYRVDPPELVRDPPDPALAEKWKGAGFVARPHVENWLDCIKTRSRPNAPIEIGHRSNTVCLLVNIARELGRSVRWDPKTERFTRDDIANRLIRRSRRKGFEI